MLGAYQKYVNVILNTPNYRIKCILLALVRIVKNAFLHFFLSIDYIENKTFCKTTNQKKA